MATNLTWTRDKLDGLHWLFDVHLSQYRAFAARTAMAVLDGNEDCPERVTLYADQCFALPIATFERQESQGWPLKQVV